MSDSNKPNTKTAGPSEAAQIGTSESGNSLGRKKPWDEIERNSEEQDELECDEELSQLVGISAAQLREERRAGKDGLSTVAREERSRLLASPGMSTPMLARLLGGTDDTFDLWKQEDPVKGAAVGKLFAVGRLWDTLLELMEPQKISNWLETPIDALQGQSPIQLIDRGELEALEDLLFYAESGIPT